MTVSDQDMKRAVALHRQGHLDAAWQIYQSVLRANPGDIDALHYCGLVHYQKNDLAAATDMLRRAAGAAPDNADILSNFGMVLSAQGRHDEAVALFVRALKISPSHVDALTNLAVTMKEQNCHREALPILQRVLRMRPRSANACFHLGETLYRLGRVDEAVEHYLRALEIDADDRTVQLALGEALESVGRFSEARQHYLSVLKKEERDVLALSRLLQLRGGEVDPGHVEAATRLCDDPDVPLEGRVRLNVALAHFHDQAARYDQAFRHLQSGWKEQRAVEPFDSNGFSRAIDELIEVFSRDIFSNLQEAPSGGDRPVFIVGMPRSGTTLAEQILASHSRVAAGGELPALLQVGIESQRAAPGDLRYPRSVRRLDGDARRRLAAMYLDSLDRISPAALRVTDKLPFNFLHLGLVALLMPGARIVHCRRDPLDTCLSCHFTSFNSRIRFASDLETLGRYYADYERLMRHWEQVLPIRMLTLQYEDLVTDTEARIRQLLAYCGLEWEEQCLRFHETERSINTPSRWQVRQPIYGRSMQRWRNYEAHLAPLIDALGRGQASDAPR